ncbi:MAG: hypothetical protein OSA40_02400 [Phycisphaerales bacterium]|nr:hypothetical protein [Phycisphaerales bacterium]
MSKNEKRRGLGGIWGLQAGMCGQFRGARGFTAVPRSRNPVEAFWRTLMESTRIHDFSGGTVVVVVVPRNFGCVTNRAMRAISSELFVLLRVSQS